MMVLVLRGRYQSKASKQLIVIGASLSEPHTSQNRLYYASVSIYASVYVRFDRLTVNVQFSF